MTTETNTGFTNSLVSTRIRLVYTALDKTFDEATKTFDTSLTSLQITNDGVLDYVHGLRDTYQADLVSLVIADSQYCGIAYVDANVPVGAKYAFSVIASDCITGGYTVGHEFGHK